MQQEDIKFIRATTNAAAIAASTTWKVDLSDYVNEFGNNFNTLTIVNRADEDVMIMLDGHEVQFVNNSNGTFSFDWEDGVIYNELAIKNLIASEISIGEIKISVGRTGVHK